MKILSFTKFFSIVLSIFMASLAIAADDLDNDTSYKVIIPQYNHHIAIVTASLKPIDKKFDMFPGANQLPKRWSTFVSDVQITDENGRPLPITAMEDGSWQLSKLPQGRVTLSYQVNLEHENHNWSGGVDGAAYLRDWGVFYTARSLFVVNGEARENINIEFDLPPHWQVTTPWQRRSGATQSFSVPGHDTLSTSMLFAGTHRQLSIKQGQFELLLALGGEQILAQEEQFTELTKGVLQYYTDLMGGIPRLQTQDATIRSVVVINPSTQTDGEALGNNISILLESNGDQM